MPATSFKLISLDTILNEPMPPIDWLVEPLLSRGSRVVVYGEWGSFKSWGLLDLALHIANGQPWLGKFTVPCPFRVLYVDEEMTQRLLRRRVKRLAIGMGLTVDTGMFRALSRRGLRCDVSGIAELLTDLKHAGFDPDVVIIETLRRVLVGNENEAKDITAFWRYVDPILLAGKTLIVSHHMRKPNQMGGNNTRHRASGSTDILGATDEALAFERKAKDAFIIEHVKCRDGEEAESFAVSFQEDQPEGPVSLIFEGAASDLTFRPTKQEQAKQLIRNFLQASPARMARTEELLAHLGAQNPPIGDRTSERALKILHAEGHVDYPDGRHHGVHRLVTFRQPPSAYKEDGDGGSPPPSPSTDLPPAIEPPKNGLAADDDQWAGLAPGQSKIAS
jgi:hypothetical protein